MDNNKLKVLNDISYHIPKVCEFCSHSDLSKDGWGYCNFHSYKHLKHNEQESRLSITQFGSCFDFRPSSLKMTKLGKFAEFVK